MVCGRVVRIQRTGRAPLYAALHLDHADVECRWFGAASGAAERGALLLRQAAARAGEDRNSDQGGSDAGGNLADRGGDIQYR